MDVDGGGGGGDGSSGGAGGQSSSTRKEGGRHSLRLRIKLKPQISRSEGKECAAIEVSEPAMEKKDLEYAGYLEEQLHEIYRRNEKFEKTSRRYANTAIDYYNFKGNNNYEVVKLGSVGATSLGRDVIIHTNFKAKRKDDPDAPVEMFFAQLKLLGRADYVLTQRMIVEDCTNLGPCKELPDEPHNARCNFCSGLVYHPKGLKIWRTRPKPTEE